MNKEKTRLYMQKYRKEYVKRAGYKERRKPVQDNANLLHNYGITMAEFNIKLANAAYAPFAEGRCPAKFEDFRLTITIKRARFAVFFVAGAIA